MPRKFKQLISSIEATNRKVAQRAKLAVNTNLTLRKWLIGCCIEESQLHGMLLDKLGKLATQEDST